MIGLSERKRIFVLATLFYFLLLFDSGFYFVARGGMVLYMQVLLAGVLAIVCKARISRNSFLILCGLAALVLVGTIVSGDSIRDYAVSMAELITSFLIACAFTGKKSKEATGAIRVVMIAISICSLIAFVFTTIRLGIIAHLPVFSSSNNVECYFWGLSFSYVPGKYYIVRNLGIFWEPGAFQTYVILALLYELFVGKRVLPRVIYTVTILTTLSSTGIVCLLLIWIIYGFSTSNRREGFLLLALLVSILSVLYFRLDFLPDSIRFNLVEKVQSVFNGNSQEYVTVTTRVNSILYGIELLLQRPFSGIGRGLGMLKEMAGNSVISCTPINWMLQYGLIFGSIAFIGLYRFLRGVSCSHLTRLGLFGVILISISTEAFNISPTIFFLIFLGYAIDPLRRSSSVSR